MGWRAGSLWLLCGLWWKNTWGGSPACNSMQRIMGAFRQRRVSSGYGDSWRIWDCLLRLSRSCSCHGATGVCALRVQATAIWWPHSLRAAAHPSVLQSGTSARRRLGREGALCAVARSQQSAWPQHFLATSFVLPSTSCRNMARPSTCTGWRRDATLTSITYQAGGLKS